MRRPQPAFAVRALAFTAVMAALSVWTLRAAEPLLPRERVLEELAYYPSGRWLEAMSMGERPVIADLTWIRAMQYYGEHRQTDNRFDLLHHAMDVVTDFDPSHRNAYVFGGTSLAQEAGRFKEGERLLLKAREANPDAWIYPFELGFIHYVERRDYATAAMWFREAARKPNRPQYVERFGAFSAQRAGFRGTALELWQRVAEETDHSVLRDKAVTKALELASGTAQEDSVRSWAERLMAGGRS